MTSGRLPRPAVATALAEPDGALAGLLESLLAEVPGPSPENASSAADAPPLQEAQTHSAFGGVASAQERAPDGAAVEQPGRSRPSWADSGRFPVLRFRVCGQWIAAPLVSLRRIERLDQPLRHLPGQAAARCGVVLLRGRVCTVFDLGRSLGLRLSTQPRPGGYLVVGGDGTQAFYCEEMGATRLLVEADVRWARAGGPHWLAGVVADDLSVLVDVARLFEVVGHE